MARTRADPSFRRRVSRVPFFDYGFTQSLPGLVDFTLSKQLPSGTFLDLLRHTGLLTRPFADPSTQQRSVELIHAWTKTMNSATSEFIFRVIAQHGAFCASLGLPLFPITSQWVSVDLARRVRTPCAVELHHYCRGPGTLETPFPGYWSCEDVDRTMKVLEMAGQVTASLWGERGWTRPAMEDDALRFVRMAAELTK